MQMVGNFSARTSMLALAATFATGIGLATPVAAQDTAAAAESMDEEGGAIVVTARRREERLVDVPIAVSSFSGEQLANAGAIEIERNGELVGLLGDAGMPVEDLPVMAQADPVDGAPQ